MSDKPAGECTCNAELRGATEHSSTCLAANRPHDNPASGEWTAENISEKTGFVSADENIVNYTSLKEFVERICTAHNAALAASFESGRIEQGLAMGTEIHQLKQQLAAERELATQSDRMEELITPICPFCQRSFTITHIYEKEAKVSEKPAGEQCTCGNLGPEQGIPNPLCPIHKHAWDKPATGEWTADTVFALLMSQEDDHLAHEAVADAHNAALAVEREKAGKVIGAYVGIADERERQLAAELERSKELSEDLNHLDDKLIAEQEAHAATGDQLAAEREVLTAALELANTRWIEEMNRWLQAQKQLAAEKEKSRILSSIVESLRAKLPPEETNPLMKQMADSLEQKWNKVKEAK